MEKILIISATEFEIEAFKNKVSLEKDSRFEFIITGVGMLETCFSITHYLLENKHLINPNTLLLNVGIAGAFNHTTTLGDIYEVEQDILSELGAENKECFISIDELGFGKSNFERNPKIETGLTLKKSITVNKVHGNQTSIQAIIERLNPNLESMEGASVFFTAEKFQMPTQQIRSVSNYVEERNKEKWDIPLAIKSLNNWLIEFFYPVKSL